MEKKEVLHSTPHHRVLGKSHELDSNSDSLHYHPRIVISSLTGVRVQLDLLVVSVGIDYCQKDHGRVPCP